LFPTAYIVTLFFNYVTVIKPSVTLSSVVTVADSVCRWVQIPLGDSVK